VSYYCSLTVAISLQKLHNQMSLLKWFNTSCYFCLGKSQLFFTKTNFFWASDNFDAYLVFEREHSISFRQFICLFFKRCR